MIPLPKFDSQDEVDDRAMNIELQTTESTGKDGESSVDGEDDVNARVEEGELHHWSPATESQIGDDALQEASSDASRSALIKRLLSLQRQRKKLTFRQTTAVIIGTLPVAVCSLEMIPDRCHICRDDMELDAYFFMAAVCGGFAAVIYGNTLDYWMPRLLGGSISALGSLFTIWMLLTSIPSNLAFLFFFVGILGAMPGVVIYFLMKIVADECFVSDVDDYDEIAPLTKIRITSVD